MGYYCNSDMQDAFLQWLVDRANRIYVCTAEASTYTEASSTYALAYATIDQYSWTGPEAGVTTNGRRIILAETETGTITVAGVADHLAFVQSTTSTLLYVMPRSFDRTLVIGGTATIPETEIELYGPRSQ